MSGEKKRVIGFGKWAIFFLFVAVGCFVLAFGYMPAGPDATAMESLGAILVGFGGAVVLGSFCLCVRQWTSDQLIGRYEWIYVMPDDEIVIKPNYDDEAFRKADRIYRMKVGGWFRVSRQMMTPFEGKRIDYIRYDGDGDMTITLPHATFTVPVSIALRYIGCFDTSDFGVALDCLLGQAKHLRRLDEEYRREITVLENHLRGLLCCLRGDESHRPAKWITKLRDDIISTLREELPHSSNFRRESMIVGEDSNEDFLIDALALIGEKDDQKDTPTSAPAKQS